VGRNRFICRQVIGWRNALSLIAPYVAPLMSSVKLGQLN
jgi:hypothetical protein